MQNKGGRHFPIQGQSGIKAITMQKHFFCRAFQYSNMTIAKLWLDRMIENNNTLHLCDFEIEHTIFETNFKSKV